MTVHHKIWSKLSIWHGGQGKSRPSTMIPCSIRIHHVQYCTGNNSCQDARRTTSPIRESLAEMDNVHTRLHMQGQRPSTMMNSVHTHVCAVFTNRVVTGPAACSLCSCTQPQTSHTRCGQTALSSHSSLICSSSCTQAAVLKQLYSAPAHQPRFARRGTRG